MQLPQKPGRRELHERNWHLRQELTFTPPNDVKAFAAQLASRLKNGPAVREQRWLDLRRSNCCVGSCSVLKNDLPALDRSQMAKKRARLVNRCEDYSQSRGCG